MNTSVSVVIPNYNKGEFLRHSLDSLLRQTYGAWEAIVVDDCSCDVSWAIIQEYATKDRRFTVVRNKTNMGGDYCRNHGATIARGGYLVFLDSDDWLADDCLENRVKEFEEPENRDVDLLIFNMIATKNDCDGEMWTSGDRNDPLASFLRHSIVWQTMMPIWRREYFIKIGGFDEMFPRMQDVELHTRALLRGCRYKFSRRKTPDCYYYVSESRVLMNRFKLARSFVESVRMYVEKMQQMIGAILCEKDIKRWLLGNLLQTPIVAMSYIGGLYQNRLISKKQREILFKKLIDGADWYARCHAYLYRLGITRIKGVNFFSLRLHRFLIRLRMFPRMFPKYS